jgi:phosphohistidine phosphatase SixA
MRQLAAAILVLASACVHSSALPPASSAPRDGAELVTRMHDRYVGKWYNTVIFTQTTTQHAPDGTAHVSTWHESLRAPGTLRIDVGAPADGNVIIYTRDSSYRVRAGKLIRAEPDANPFMPFVVTMYHVPVSETLGELGRWHFDLTRIRLDTLAGRPTWVVGARDANDTTSAQFWVDAERLVVTRFITAPAAMAPGFDVLLERYEPLAGGWIATDVDIRIGGKSVQREQYADLRGNVDLPLSLFDPHQWPVGAPPQPTAAPTLPPNTRVILVRHAEKADTTADPALSAAGQQRASALADSLARSGIAAIVVSQMQRTRLTAQPLAGRLGLEPIVVPVGGPPGEHEAAIASIIHNRFAGKTVLVVGHSNTVPAIIRALGVSDAVAIPDWEYDDLFTVTSAANGTITLTRSHYGQPAAAR